MYEDTAKRLEELYRTCWQRDVLTHSMFLTPDEQSLFLGARHAWQGVRCLLTGGYDAAERQVAVFLPSYMEDLSREDSPVRWLHITPDNERYAEDLTHRDYLGAIMNLGIERDRTGDIIIDGKSAWAAHLPQLSDYLTEHLTQVRHTKVYCRTEELPDSIRRPRLKEITGTVASVRLDALVGTAFRLSRGAASDTIKAGYVYIDGRQILSPGESVREGSVISVRHRGKFRYMGQEGQSKKGRCIIRLGIY